MLCLLLASALFFLLVALYIDSRKPNNFPPGPAWVPIIGNYYLFYHLRKKFGFTHLVWEQLSKKYGSLIGLRLGNDKLVIGTGQSVVKELLCREQFDARPDGFFFRYRALGGRYGLVFVDGEFFNEQKRFVMKHLKSFGLNKSEMEDRINVETAELIQAFQKSPQGEVLLPEVLEVSVLNTLWRLTAGERWGLDDPRARHLLAQVHASFRLADMSGGVLNQMPILRFLSPRFTSFDKLNHLLTNLTSFIKDLIEDHRRSLSEYENRDLIDAFLNEMKKHKGESTTFTENQLIVLLLDLFMAGSETVSSTLGFAILMLMHYPKIQEKIHREMDAVIGKNKQPCLQHKNRLVYFEAFIMELQRYVNVTATTVSHRAKEATQLQGFTIPKDSIVLANLYSLHMDRDHWGDPENFRPERFLNSNGEIIQDDWLIPFGLGKRRCLGEALARTSIFLFLSAILHKFEVRGRSGEPLPPIQALDGATLVPLPFTARLLPRH